MDQRRVCKSCVRFAVLCVSFSAVLSFAAQAATAPVGATPGSFSVDPNGGANYTIPIQIPPGSAGTAPSIALTYTKQVDNPLVGVGFSISGLSIISRCGSTVPLDGAKGGVYYDSRDRSCLDGQRLIAVNGAYRAHNTEHRPVRVACPGNGGARLLPYNSVRFVYGPRTDIVPVYEAGSMIKVTQRLSTIQTYTDSASVRTYTLPYDGNGAGNRSRLISMQECGSDGICLPTTTFSWQSSGSYTPAALQKGQFFLGHPS